MSTTAQLPGLASADFEIAPEPSFLLELETGRIVAANAAAVGLTGRSKGELVGLLFDAFAANGAAAPYHRLLEAARRDGAATAIELALSDASGATLPVHADAWLAEGARGEAGAASGGRGGQHLLHVLVHDGSELSRERAERARRRGAQRLASLGDVDVRELLDQLLEECIALTESRIGYLYFYDEATREFTLHAWSREVMKACAIMAPQTIYHLDRTGIWGEAVRQRRAILVNEFQAANPLKRGYPEGHAALHRFFTIPVFRREQIVAVVGVANRETPYAQHDVAMLERFVGDAWDLVERTRDRQALAEGRTRLELALEGAHAGTFHWDAAFDQTQWDDRLLGIYGIRRDALDGRSRPWSTLVPPSERGRNEAAFARLLLDGGPFFLEYAIQRADGEVRACKLRAQLLRDPHGEVRGLSGLVFDVTETIRVIEERNRLEERARRQQQLAGLETLARGVAHEFNNLLQLVVASASELRSVVPTEGDGPELLAAIDEASRRGAEVCRHLLAASGRDVGTPRRLDLSEAVRHAESAARNAAPSHATLLLALAADLPPVVADATALREALVGLCANAFESLPASGGHVVVETGVQNVDAALLGSALAASDAAACGLHAFVEVRDDGGGLDRETLGHLFEPFFSTKGFGRGLGLASVLGVVRAHGGFVTVTSAPGAGASFRLWLPAARTAASERSHESARPPASGRSPN